MKFCLASASPRRVDVLKRVLNEEFITFSTNIDERIISGKEPKELCLDFARAKARKGQEAFPDHVVIAADTIVVSPAGLIFGKPRDREQAESMLKSLSGRKHEVITALVLRHNDIIKEDVDKAYVYFNNLSASDIEEYIQRFPPYDKAGGYGVQDSFPLIKRIDGDPSTVLGMSETRLRKMINEPL